MDAEKFKIWRASRFIANLIIEKKAEIPEGSTFAVTSKNSFDEFANTFLGENPPAKLIEIVSILNNSTYIAESEPLNKLPIDEGVIAICDTLYSRSKYNPILISNIPKKKEYAESFYRKSDPKARKIKIPFPIYGVGDAEMILRGRFPELCKIVDERMEGSGY